jgi:DNA-3-methyladenine glycosylase I
MSKTLQRCGWAGDDPLMQAYHDKEWGLPQRNPRMLWEMLMLEGFQAGLSWRTVLHKREAFRKAFKDFDPVKVARFDARDIARLMGDEGIIRARAKIEAAIAGAGVYNAMGPKAFGAFCWSFTDGVPLKGDGKNVPTETELSKRISKDLKHKGFKFVGPTIVYAWMQAVGIVNDHAARCFRRAQV